MWAYDNYKEDGCYMVDGTAEAFSMLKYAMAILTEASDKIIYFPCKQDGIGRYYRENYNLILCTPKAQLRRSSWISIRRKIKKSPKLTYTLQYNREKLDDYCKSKLILKETDIRNQYREYYTRTEIDKKIRKDHLEELVGENLFMVMSKDECYINHFHIAHDLDEYSAGDKYGAWTALGWIITETGIKNMNMEAGKEKEECHM